ncbi:hypothetical protein TNCV_3734691 [Trichonephila clavipes]|nr:hypothetical protein TNCV_3734691 [Trichonephila clavipes]
MTHAQSPEEERVAAVKHTRVCTSWILVKVVPPECLGGPSIDSDRLNAHPWYSQMVDHWCSTFNEGRQNEDEDRNGWIHK